MVLPLPFRPEEPAAPDVWPFSLPVWPVVWAPLWVSLWLPLWLPAWPLDCPAELELPVEPDPVEPDEDGVPCAAIQAVQARKVMVSKIVFDI